jgi:hypothetical protein
MSSPVPRLPSKYCRSSKKRWRLQAKYAAKTQNTHDLELMPQTIKSYYVVTLRQVDIANPVNKRLKRYPGAKVSELPLEFPPRFELSINLKTAKAMALRSRKASS